MADDRARRAGKSLPTLSSSDWAKAIAPRAGIPAGCCALYCLAVGASALNPSFGLIGVIAFIAVVWLGHWYYAQWYRQGDKEHATLAVVVIRAIFASLVALTCVLVLASNDARAAALAGYSSSFAEILPTRLSTFESASVWAVFWLFAGNTFLGKLFQKATSAVQVSEGMWWLDQVVKYARIALYILTVFLALACLTLFAYRFTSLSLPLLEFFTWREALVTISGEMVSSGLALIYLLFALFRMASARFELWTRVAHEERQLQPLLESVLHILWVTAQVIVYMLLAIGAFGCLAYLVNPLGLTWTAVARLLMRALLSPALVLCALGFVAVRILWEVYKTWRESARQSWQSAVNTAGAIPHERPLPLRALCWIGFIVLVVFLVWQSIRALGGIVSSIAYGEESYTDLQLIGQDFSVGLINTNYWGFLVNCAITILKVLVILAVIGFVIGALVTGGGGGGGAGSGSGAGGSSFAGSSNGFGGINTGGSHAGGSLFDSPTSMTINDRYGRKLLEMDQGIFGETYVRDKHGRIVGRNVRTSLDGGYTRIDDTQHHTKVRIQDALLSDDKVVKDESGHVIGRISKDSHGELRYRENRKR